MTAALRVGGLSGTQLLTGFILRRDRRRLALWVLGLIGLVGLSADSIYSLYATPEQVQQYVTSVEGNPAVIMFAGPGYGFDDPNVGTILVNELSLWMALACAVMSMLLMVRHTRAEEDNGGADLVRAQPVGRNSPITAAMTVAIGANLIIGLVSAAVMIAVGFDVAGSIALSTSFALVGVVFAGVTAVSSQFAPTARAASGLTAAVLAVTYILRGVGDIREGWLSWASPFGWGLGVRAFASERWWTLALLVLLAALLIWLAFWLIDRRDLGSGLLQERRGQPVAAPWLANPTAMAWRMQRMSIGGWATGVFVMALLFGSVSDAIESMIETSPELAEFMPGIDGASVTEAFLASSLAMLALLAAGFALSSSLRTRSEETSGHAEMLLATPTSRPRFVVAHVWISVAGCFLLMLAAGLGLAIGNALVVGNTGEFVALLVAAIQLLPAVLVFVGVGIAVFGWLPHQTAAAWITFAASVVIGILGDLLDLPNAATAWSPFEMLAAVPAEDFEALPALGLLAVSAVLVSVGVWRFANRDLEP